MCGGSCGSWLEPAEARSPGREAQPGGDHRLGQGELAPGKKNAISQRRWIIFQDESGFSLTPPIRRTWAPPGKTLVVTDKFNWKRVSASAALCYRWDGKYSRVYLATRAAVTETGSGWGARVASWVGLYLIRSVFTQ